MTTTTGALTDVTQKCTRTESEFAMANHANKTNATPTAISQPCDVGDFDGGLGLDDAGWSDMVTSSFVA